MHTGIPGQPIAEYTYDGDGNLVLAEEGGKVTVYIGPHFEACLSGCAPAGSTPTPTPTATATSTATATGTATPTATPTATATPTPTATATATPTPTSTSTPAGPYTFTSQPDANGLDTCLSKSSPSSTHGSLEYIAVGEEAGANDKVRRSLLTFDLSSLPANAVVQSATLSLWMYNEVSSKDRTLRVYRLLRTWDEASATWNQASSGVNWQTAGANGAADRESAAIGSRAFTANESTGEKQFILDAAKVQKWISGGLENRGMIVIADTERDDQYYFRSSDYTTASQRPKLVIVYTLAQGRAAPMQAIRANVSYSGGFQSSGVSQGNGTGLNLATQVKSRPRQVKGLGVQLSLSRQEGVVWRSYYFAGATRIALREDSDDGSQVYYILTDHLGSTSVTYRSGDGQVDRQWYKPWGEIRQVTGEMPTDYQFTGQRNSGWGLYNFKARWFDSQLGRFAQADSIIPGAGFSIAWDRYAGMANNPLNYIDPSGHKPLDCDKEGGKCEVDPQWKIDKSCNKTIYNEGRVCRLAPRGNWNLSSYVYAKTSDASKDPRVNHSNELISIQVDGEKVTAPFRFWFGNEGIAMQGSGILDDGRLIASNPGKGNWISAEDTQYDYWDGEIAFEFGWGLPGRELRPYKDAAVGDSYFGSLFYVPVLKGYKSSNGLFQGIDRGGKIEDGNMDIFTGIGIANRDDYIIGIESTPVYEVICDP